MSSDSRARLITYLCQAGLSTVRANAVVDNHDHELAEKIRRAWSEHDAKKPGNVCILSALNAADFIDPEEAS